MTFDWPKFFERNQVKFVTTGPNVAREHVAVHCPFCGSSDPSQHMSVSLEGKGWRCWRNPAHRGKHPAYLIQALLNCTLDHAYSLVDGTTNIPTDFQGMVTKYLQPHLQQPSKKQKLTLPEEFKPFKDVPSARM